jgi:ABC-type lipopolysaccharide export system ATPase subunit
MENNPRQAAPVSVDVPLISNQSVLMNIALIKQYHENMPLAKVQPIVFSALQRLKLEHIAYKRNPDLTNEERFFAMLLRAAMVRDALIIIDRPFKIVPHLKNIDYIFQALKNIEDFYLNCHIYDYEWMREKYEALSK